MLTELWSGLGGRLAERWMLLLLSPALAFWTGGLATWIWRYVRPKATRTSWREVVEGWATTLGDLSPVAAGALVVGLLVALTVSGIAVGAVARPLLNSFARDWPLWTEPMLRPVLRWRRKRIAAAREELRAILAVRADERTDRQRFRQARLEQRYRRTPPDPHRQTFSGLGDVLRAYEGRPAAHYGLDPTTCWPKLWMVLPDDARQAIAAARQRLDSAAQAAVWGVLFLVWTPLAWWAAPLGLLVAAVAYRRMRTTAEAYGELFAATFGVHRVKLYEAMRWPLPANPAQELVEGARLSRYLLSGSRSTSPSFTEPVPDAASNVMS